MRLSASHAGLTLSGTLLLGMISACSGGAPGLTAGSTWTVQQTTNLQSLTVPQGAQIVTPAGKNLTMTVDGVERDIAPGSYNGKIVLTVTDDILVKYSADLEHHFRTALYVDDGKVVTSKSVSSALSGGTVTDTAATDVSITSNGENFNGILVTGNSKYSIVHPTIRFTGNGGNDFAGYGAAIMATGHADVTVDNASIINHGVVRTAVFVGNDATLHMNNCTIEVYNGTLPADYQWNVDLGKMKEVPWMLGLSGNVRATNLVDNGTAYYNNCHVKSQGWGALSTDATKHVRMYVTHTTIETTDSGYGAYSIGDSVDTFSDTTFNVADIGLIIGAEGSAVFTDGSKVTSGRFGVMMHTGVGGGTLTIEKGSVFNTQSTAIEVKGRGTTIVVDNAELHAGNGLLLEAMPNDDPFLKKMMAAPPPAAAPAAAPPVGGSGSAANVGTVGASAQAIFSPDVVATLRNATLTGDLINARPDQGDLKVTLDKATLTGAISTAVASPSTGQEPTEQTRRLIGDVKNMLGASSDRKRGAQVTVGDGSHWTVTQTSYLTRLTLAAGARVDSLPGKRLSLTVNRAATALKPGQYAGRLVLSVR